MNLDNPYNKNNIEYYKDKFPYYYEYISQLDIAHLYQERNKIYAKLSMQKDPYHYLFYTLPSEFTLAILLIIAIISLFYMQMLITDKIVQYFSISDYLSVSIINSFILFIIGSCFAGIFFILEYIVKKNVNIKRVVNNILLKYANFEIVHSSYDKEYFKDLLFTNFIDLHKKHVIALEDILLQKDIHALYNHFLQDKNITSYDNKFFSIYKNIIYYFANESQSDYELIFIALIDYEISLNKMLEINKTLI